MIVLIAHQTVTDGDAIGNDILNMLNVLASKGIEAKIILEYTSAAIPKRFYADLSDLQRANLLIYHHSIYWEKGEDIFINFKGKRVLRYHNITPPHFFKTYSEMYYLLTKKGREQTYRLCKSADFCIADSQYNAEELIKIGCDLKKIYILPPLHQLKDLKEARLSSDVSKNLSLLNSTKVLTVGRIAPNKGLIDVVKVAAAYKYYFGENAVFYIVGAFDENLIKYTHEINTMINKFNLSSMVYLTGKVSLSELKSFYTNCDLYLCLSEHEGFCVPLIEAQQSKLPIIAIASSAIPETLGNGQLVFDKIDYFKIAAAIKLLSERKDYRDVLIENGLSNLKRFEINMLKEMFYSIIQIMINNH